MLRSGSSGGSRHRVLGDRADAERQAIGREERHDPEQVELGAAEGRRHGGDREIRDDEGRELVPADVGPLAGSQPLIALRAFLPEPEIALHRRDDLLVPGLPREVAEDLAREAPARDRKRGREGRRRGRRRCRYGRGGPDDSSGRGARRRRPDRRRASCRGGRSRSGSRGSERWAASCITMAQPSWRPPITKSGDRDRQRIRGPADQRHAREDEAPVDGEGEGAPAIVEGEDLPQLLLRELALPVRLGRFHGPRVGLDEGVRRIHGSSA